MSSNMELASVKSLKVKYLTAVVIVQKLLPRFRPPSKHKNGNPIDLMLLSDDYHRMSSIDQSWRIRKLRCISTCYANKPFILLRPTEIDHASC